MINKSNFLLGLNASCVCLSLFMYADRVYAQSANQSTVTNSAAPNAISTTTGGSNLTYQSNNTYNNEFGFGPGIFCRTPALFISGNLNQAEADNYYFGATNPLPVSSNDNFNYGGSIGIVIPFGSSIQEYCKSVARQTAVDREVSTQLSMIRACAALIKEGIRVDPDKFPLLSSCVVNEGQPLLYIGTQGSPNPQAGLPPVSLPRPKPAQSRQTQQAPTQGSSQLNKEIKVPRLSAS
jgi:hypothetical protein